MTAAADPEHRPAAPTALMFVLLGSMFAFLPVGMDFYLPAVPEIGRALKADPGTMQLTLAAYFVGIAGGQFIWGPASDRFGRRTPLFVGIAVFIAATIGCSLSPNVETLILMRFIQAIGVSASMVIVRAIVFDMFGVREGARFTSHLMLIMGVAPILAPIVGGWIVVHSDWRVVFYAVAALSFAISLTAYFRLPETRSAAAALTSRGESVFASLKAVITNKRLIRTSIVGALGSASFYTYISNAPALLMNGYGIAPEHFGFFFGFNAIGGIAASQINRAILVRMHPEDVLDRSVIVTFCLGVLLALFAFTGWFGMWGVLTPLFFVIASFPFVFPNAAAIAQGEDMQRPGVVATVTGALGHILGAACAAITGAFVDGTARPLAVTVVVATGLALILRWTSQRRRAMAQH
ncbi:MAG: multidrug effflux MFS transporter [Caulobacterales bacterium]